ncbi:MAG: hemerythrin domain-containing protein [Acidimicrobiia bacterium]|nr:hemerythrin domain-containing protein [Acidimicrobiia bacterium]NNF09679.1 hemerythrin domain-containing protein [Acidimicrobiia bacterium]NNL68776.1 hemerythrin domain-containing protein [Acidimicrobiia bacterium]
MDAIEVLKSDHDKARELFLEFRAASSDGDTEKMADVTERIFRELELHTEIEERVFYPAVKEAGGSELADQTDESNEEHHVVDVLMGEVRALDPSDDAYAAKMKVLIENVEHHASEEEKEMFPKVRNLFSDEKLSELGAALQREKQVVRVEKMTVEDLHEAAAQLEIDGRSGMNRSELASAVLGTLTGGSTENV